MLMDIERVILLKSVDIFADTDDAVISELAAILGETTFAAGEVIITENELGSTMHIIARGRVRVEQGGAFVVELGEREIVGELAAIDPEIRSATVVALEETTVLTLKRRAFYELIADHHEIARGVLRVLTRRIRATLAS